MVTDSNGCESPLSAMTSVTVNPLPAQPTITVNGPVTFCDGDSVTLATSSGLAQYLWSSGDTTSAIIVRQSGSFDLMVTDSNGCESPLSAILSVTTVPIPPKPGIIRDGDTLRSSVMGTAYQWWLNGMILPDSTQSILAVDTGSYQVVVLSEPCMSELSDEFLVTVSVDKRLQYALSIFPNPNQGWFYVQARLDRASLVQLTLYSQHGQLLYDQTAFASEGILYEQIYVPQLAAGIYLLRIRVNDRFAYRKIEIMR
jgi:hypothetical protein